MKIDIAKSANQNKHYEIKITGENTKNIKTAEQKIIEITKQADEGHNTTKRNHDQDEEYNDRDNRENKRLPQNINCWYLLNEGSCKNKECAYKHPKPEPCKYHAQGRCNLGNKCYNQH